MIKWLENLAWRGAGPTREERAFRAGVDWATEKINDWDGAYDHTLSKEEIDAGVAAYTSTFSAGRAREAKS